MERLGGEWGRRQSWKAVRFGEARVLYAFKSGKMVGQWKTNLAQNFATRLVNRYDGHLGEASLLTRSPEGKKLRDASTQTAETRKTYSLTQKEDGRKEA